MVTAQPNSEQLLPSPASDIEHPIPCPNRPYFKVANFSLPLSAWHYRAPLCRQKVRGRQKERSLRTTDRKIAERRLKEWIAGLEQIDSEVEKTTVRELIDRFIAVNRGTAPNTQVTTCAIIKRFVSCWPYGLDTEVRNIRPSQLDEWLALEEPRLRNTTYNRYAGFLKQLFDIAVNDRIIWESPCKRLRTPWKKPQTPIRLIPTLMQFENIVTSIRSQRFTDHAHQSADFVEFLGRAGLGQAEAAALTWADVGWELERLTVRRHKTDTRFYVPLYPELKRLLLRLHESAGNVPVNSRVFPQFDPTKSQQTADCSHDLGAFAPGIRSDGAVYLHP